MTINKVANVYIMNGLDRLTSVFYIVHQVVYYRMHYLIPYKYDFIYT